MEKYVSLIKNNRKLFILIFICINIVALVGLFQIRINPDFEIFIPESSQYKDTLEEMNNSFSNSEQIAFLIESKNNNLSKDYLQKLRDFQIKLEKIDNIAYIQGPTPESITIGNQTITLDEFNKDKQELLKEYYKKMGKLSPVSYKNNKIYAEYLVFPTEKFTSNNLHKIEDYLKENNYTYYASGDLYMQQKVLDYILYILLFLPPAAIVLILFVFKTQMGSLKATFLSIMPAGIAALWTLGTVGWIGKEVSILTVLAPIFTIVIGSADGLHFISHIQEEQEKNDSMVASIVKTLKMVGIPMIITTVTSIAGFLSLLIMNTNAIHDLAVFASLGIFLAGVATWYILPLILSGNISLSKPKKEPATFITGGIKKLWGSASVMIVVILLIISLWGIKDLKTEFNLPMIYRDFTEVHQSFEKIKEVNGGSIPLYLLVKTNKDPLLPQYGNKILELEDKLTKSKNINKAVSVYDFYSNLYSSSANLDKPQYPDQMLIVNMIDSQISQRESNPSSQLVNRKDNITRVMLFPSDLKNKTLDKIHNQISAYNKQDDDIEIDVTGIQYLMRDLNQNMVNNQTQTLAIAFILIFFLLYISLRKFMPSLISLLPIGITVIILFGFLGFSGISLNLFTATIFSITIGVGIDYAVHFTSIWMSFKNEGNSSEKAVQLAYKYTSRPIMANALGLAIGLSALLFSPLRIHLYVSVLMWISMLSGVFLSLSFLPTILKRVK